MSDRENFATYTTAERFTSLVYIDLLKYIQKEDQEPDWNMGKRYEVPVH